MTILKFCTQYLLTDFELILAEANILYIFIKIWYLFVKGGQSRVACIIFKQYWDNIPYTRKQKIGKGKKYGKSADK